MSGNLGQIIFFCAAIGIGICSIMAYYGFQGRINTIGVDLGTTLSVVGYKSRSKVINIYLSDTSIRLRTPLHILTHLPKYTHSFIYSGYNCNG